MISKHSTYILWSLQIFLLISDSLYCVLNTLPPTPHIHMHLRRHTHSHVPVCTHMHLYACLHRHLHTRARTHITPMHTQLSCTTHTHAITTCTHTHYSYMHTCSALPPTSALIHDHTHTDAHAYTQMHAHRLTHGYTHALTHVSLHTHGPTTNTSGHIAIEC